MAETFVYLPQDQEESVKLEDTGKEHFDELVTRSFLQPSGDKENFRMHDLIHDLAQSVSSTYCKQLGIIKDCKSLEDVRHLSLLDPDVRHLSLLGPNVEELSLRVVDEAHKLRTLLLPDDHLKNFGQALDKIFQTLKCLRVLDLSSSKLSELPRSIEELKLLHYLDLSKTEIKKLPNSICNLYNLQTLKLLECPWLFSLPEDFGKLINLHYLELDDMFWFKCTALPRGMGNLTSLHTLHAFPVGGDGGYKIKELENMAYLTGALHISKLENADNAEEAKLNDKEDLRKLVLQWSDEGTNPPDEAAQERVLEDLRPHPNVEEIQLHYFKGNRLPAWMGDASFKRLVTIRLIYCTKCKVLTLGQLPHLRELYVKKLQELEEWPDQHLSLTRLEISGCSKLSKLPDLFPFLRVLKIKGCSSLIALPVTPTLLFLTLVDNPRLHDWSEEAVGISFIDAQGQRRALFRPSLVKVIELTLVRCPNLSALPCYLSPQKLEIEECESLATLPSPEFAQRFQHLGLKTCSDGSLLRAIPSTTSMYSLVISNIANLSSFPRLPHLPGLSALYIHSCKELISLSTQGEGSLQNLTSLKLLSVRDCPELTALAQDELPPGLQCLSVSKCHKLQSIGPKEVLNKLTLLKDLYIEDCNAINSLPEDGLPSSLQHLYIHGCPLLTEQCQKKSPEGSEGRFKNISDLEIHPTKGSISTSPPAPWYKCWICSKGFDKQPDEQTPSPTILQNQSGRSAQIKTEQGQSEHSKPTEPKIVDMDEGLNSSPTGMEQGQSSTSAQETESSISERLRLNSSPSGMELGQSSTSAQDTDSSTSEILIFGLKHRFKLYFNGPEPN